MPAFNQNRSQVVKIIFAGVILVIIGQLLNLQLFSAKYKLAADNNAIYRKIQFPDRGIIYDRKKRSMLENTMSNDLAVIPAEAKGVDTMDLCHLLGIDTSEYRKRVREIIFKNTSVKSSVFEALLTTEMYARLNENMYKFPGFSLIERSVRSYPYNTAAQVLGYIGEVDTSFLRRHRDEGYEMGDYTGLNGLERSYEKILMGTRGIKRYVRDNRSRIQGPYENGIFDTAAIAGRNLYTSMDVEVQQLAEKLLQNKIGSAVAINPRTGGVIAMVSSPTYNPNLLTGNTRKKNLGKMLLDTSRPMYNRAIKGQYPPGSTFKPLGALIALDEGLITPAFGYPCYGSYDACGIHIRCEHKDPGHADNLRHALANSCNSYFSQVFRMAIENPQYHSAEKGYLKWKEYMNAFGFGKKLAIDLPSADSARIQSVAQYNKDLGGPGWKSCNMVTLGIGQDRMTATPLQLANAMCIIANKGYYYVPHFVDSIENEVIEDTVYLGRYRVKHDVTHIPNEVFHAVTEGMHDVTVYGTAANIKIPGVEYCAKTGTAQNPHGKTHSIFVCYAPKDNPRIAVAVVVENAGYGATWAGPIAGYMIEKYLNDSIAADRLADIERIAKADLIPPAIKAWYQRKDSLRQAKMVLDESTAAAAQAEEIPVENSRSRFYPEVDSTKEPTSNKGGSKPKIKSPLLNPEEKRKRKDTVNP